MLISVQDLKGVIKMLENDKDDNSQMLLSSDKNYNPCLKRCPIVLIVDTSSYMNKTMDKLNASIQKLKEIMIEDSIALYSADLAIIKSGGDHATLDQEFTTVPAWKVKKYIASGVAPMGEAIDLALEQIKKSNICIEKKALATTDRYSLYLVMECRQIAQKIMTLIGRLLPISSRLLPLKMN